LARVERVARHGSRWLVQVAGADPVSCDHVVIALPSHVASPLVRPLSAELADELDHIEHCRIAVVNLGFARASVPALEGFGFLVPPSEGRRLLGCIYASSVFPWRAPEGQVLVTCLIGGATRPELVDLADDALVQLALEELKAIAQVEAEPTYRKVVKWPKAVPQYTVGHLSRVDRIFRLSNALPEFSLAGNSYRGVGINDCVRNAFELCQALCRTPGDEPQRPQVKVATTR
jgi:oxygen-dependent protoporphyrinogen oxidase